jgi:hypothetical protein
MRRVKAPADGLRSTPSICGGRDVLMFPEAHAVHIATGSPTAYCLVTGRERVTLMFEGLHLPSWIADPLRTRYAQYLAAWERQASRSWPRYGIGHCDFRGGSSYVTVKREDAAMWIHTCRAATLEAFSPQRRESWLREALSTLSHGDTRDPP